MSSDLTFGSPLMLNWRLVALDANARRFFCLICFVSFLAQAPSFAVEFAVETSSQNLETSVGIPLANIEAALFSESPNLSESEELDTREAIEDQDRLDKAGFQTPLPQVATVPQFLTPSQRFIDPLRQEQVSINPQIVAEAIEAINDDQSPASSTNPPLVTVPEPTELEVEPIPLARTIEADESRSARVLANPIGVTPISKSPVAAPIPVNVAEVLSSRTTQRESVAPTESNLEIAVPSKLPESKIAGLTPQHLLHSTPANSNLIAPLAVRPPLIFPTVELPDHLKLAAADFQFPLAAPASISSQFGWRVHPISAQERFHAGTDLAAPLGTPVLASVSGQVEFVGKMGGYGLIVLLSHRNNEYQTLYAHLSSILVQPGQWIDAGEMLGQVGSTGLSTGPHLHFELRQPTASRWVAIDAGMQLQYALADLTRRLQASSLAAYSGSQSSNIAQIID